MSQTDEERFKNLCETNGIKKLKLPSEIIEEA